MQSRSAFSITSLATSDHSSKIGLRKWRPKEVSRESLRTRRVRFNAPRADERTVEFKKFLVEKPIEIAFEQTKSLQESVEHFLRKAKKAERGENSYDAIEELCNEINKWKATVRLGVATNQEFNDDLEHCIDSSNEVAFQRTVMMSIIDRSHLKPAFDFNCEGHWSLQGNYPLPSTDDPEATRGFDNIDAAVLANMHSASQALLNIFVWMNKANHDEIFYKDVRVFSIAINVEKVIARVHRAALVDIGDGPVLEFFYDDLQKTKFSYTRDEVCTLIHNILSDYAETKLLGILKATVEKVLKEYKQDLKRKRDAATLDRPPKRLVSGQTESQGT
ncbi:hypothetical protein E0Z10_g8456 [Xylaria hypoxylon]|uniref:Uncharacterized protein n=1 Tax=Xylaria hypoxylon TaxID=37992 RepID=A0A4Z0YV72_9PEZI|nr:hypothetical protein E0Z10_g8456 [Xylaria hypoxylon]